MSSPYGLNSFLLRRARLSPVPEHESKEVTAKLLASFCFYQQDLKRKGLIKSQVLLACIQAIQNRPLEKGSRILGVWTVLCKT